MNSKYTAINLLKAPFFGFLPERAKAMGSVRAALRRLWNWWEETWLWRHLQQTWLWKWLQFTWLRRWLQMTWRWLPGRGWPKQIIDVGIAPPHWLVLLCLLVLAVICVPLLLFWVPLAVVDGRADELNKLLLAFAGLAGAPFLIWRVWIADGQRKTDNEAHFRDFLKNAVDHLGAERKDGTSNIEHRIGAIYALEKLARDCKPLHWPVMEILCTYVRRNAYRLGGPTRAAARVDDDVQTALTVIGRRSEAQLSWEAEISTGFGQKRLKLTDCCLREAELGGLNFDHADFHNSDLRGAKLASAWFRNAQLDYVDIDGTTTLTGADFEGATLENANLENALFTEAKLRGADLKSARLRSTILKGAIGLELQQLLAAHCDDSTILPDSIKEQLSS